MLLQLGETLFLFVVLSIELYFIGYFCRTHRHIAIIKRHRQLVQWCSAAILISYALLATFGYYTLAMRLTESGLMTLIITLITILILQGVHKSYQLLHHQKPVNYQVVKYFGYKPEQVFTEFLILKTTIQIAVIALSIYLVVNSWGFASYLLQSAYTQLLYGVQIADTTIYPTRILVGVLVYCCLYLFFRALSTAIIRRQQFEDEEETQVALASILTYIGFALALLCGLLAAGFNFTGLAIIAGALSVGIGLGLQSIVNNFVSGLILLIEKPIQTGDRINIDGVEGFVKKIRVRSTHIITPAYEDIIVPNSDLITKRVTNYVYSNKQCSIECDITIAAGKNTQMIRDLLLQAAFSHEDVIKTGRNKPYVLFNAFTEKGLQFQLCCVIKDVNKKRLVRSDLNFMIDQLLQDNKL
jgi:small-conductance mechanosensitive channel